MIYIGIDPGLDGAIACVGTTTAVRSVPTLFRKKAKGVKREYNIAEIIEMLRDFTGTTYPPEDCLCAIEAVHAMPKQGVTSMFSMGYGLGIWHTALAALKVPFEPVTPQLWKKTMLNGTGKDKEASRLKALQLFPTLSEQLKLKKDEGKAEALLIAEFLRRNHR